MLDAFLEPSPNAGSERIWRGNPRVLRWFGARSPRARCSR